MKFKTMFKRFVNYFKYIYAGVVIWQVGAVLISSLFDHELIAYWTAMKAVVMMLAFVIPASISAALLTRKDVKRVR